MLRRVVQVSFLLMGGTLGVLFLPQLFDLFTFSSKAIINNPYVAAITGAVLFFTLTFFLITPVVNFIKWMEDRLLSAPVFDLLFGTIGLIVGLSLAFLVSFWLGSSEIPGISSVLPTIFFVVLGYLGFQVGFKKREELIQAVQAVKVPAQKKKGVKKLHLRQLMVQYIKY